MDTSYREYLSKLLDDLTQNISAEYEVSNTGRLSKFTVPVYNQIEVDQYLKGEFGGVYDGYHPLIEEYIRFFSSRPVAQLQVWYTVDQNLKSKLGNFSSKPIAELVFHLLRSRLNYVAHHKQHELLLPYPISLFYGNIKDEFLDKRWDEQAHFQMNVNYLSEALSKIPRAAQSISALILGAATLQRLEDSPFKTYWDLYPQIDHLHRDFYPAMLASAFVFDKLFPSRMNALVLKQKAAFETVYSNFTIHLDVVKSLLRDQNALYSDPNAIYFRRIVPLKTAFKIPKSLVQFFKEREIEIALASAVRIHQIQAPMTALSYKFKPGDTWDQLSINFNIPKPDLLKMNCLNKTTECNCSHVFVPILSKDSLFYSAFDTLNNDGIQALLKTRVELKPEFVENQSPLIPPKVIKPLKIYSVRSGDTLSAIARKYRVTVKQLKTWNRLKSDNLQIGQKLVIKK
jgi:LysM repeat protein